MRTGNKQIQIFTHKRPGFSTVDDVFFLRHFSINCSESLVIDGIRFSVCFYPKKFRGLLAVECNFWKSRTAPVPTEQLHVIRDHRVTTGVTSPTRFLFSILRTSEWAEPFAHNFEGGSQVVKCCSVLNIPLPASKSSRRGSLSDSVTAPASGPARPYVNAPARCIPGPACWVSAPTPAPCGHTPAPVTGLPSHPASTPRHLHPCLCKCPLEGIISCSF